MKRPDEIKNNEIYVSMKDRYAGAWFFFLRVQGSQSDEDQSINALKDVFSDTDFELRVTQEKSGVSLWIYQELSAFVPGKFWDAVDEIVMGIRLSEFEEIGAEVVFDYLKTKVYGNVQKMITEKAKESLNE